MQQPFVWTGTHLYQPGGALLLPEQKLEEDKVPPRFRLDDKHRFKQVTIVGRGGTGLLSDRDLLDVIKIQVGEGGDRIVTMDPRGSECCKTMFMNKAQDKRQLAKKQEKEDKQKVKVTNDSAGSDKADRQDVDEDTDDDDDEEEEAREEIHQTIFCRSVNAVICRVPPPLSPRMGKTVKGYIINIISPWELHIQTGAMILKSDEIASICNREGIDSRLVLEDWLPEIGGFCAAKYEGKFYRAKILEQVGKGSFRIKYVDYGNTALVPFNEVYQLNPEVTLIPRQCIYYKLSNAKPLNGRAKWGSEVKKFTIEHLDGASVEMDGEAVERGIIHVGKLNVLSSLSGKVLRDFGGNLVAKGLAEPDSYYVE